MRLVEDDGVVAAQSAVALYLGEQDAVGHQFDQGAVARPIGEPDGVADDLAERGVQLVCDPLGDGACRQPPRLGVADHAANAPAQFHTDLGQLGRLSRTRLAGDHDDLVLADHPGDLVAALADRQFRVGDRRQRRGTRRDQCFRGGERRGQPTRVGPSLVEASAQSCGVADGQPVQPRAQLRPGWFGHVAEDRRSPHHVQAEATRPSRSCLRAARRFGASPVTVRAGPVTSRRASRQRCRRPPC